MLYFQEVGLSFKYSISNVFYAYVISSAREEMISGNRCICLPDVYMCLFSIGTSDLTTLGSHYLEVEEAVSLLCYLYNYSEVSLLHSFLESDEASSILKIQNSSTDEPKEGIEKEANNVPITDDVAESLENRDVGTLEAQLGTLSLAKDADGPRKTSEVNPKNRFYVPPQSCKELIVRVNHYLDHLEKDYKTLHNLDRLSTKVAYDSEKCLGEIILKLREIGKVEEGDLEALSVRLSEVARDNSSK